jgi:DNA polymerase-3 subunit delta'
MWSIIESTGLVPLLQNSIKHGRLPNAYLLVGPAHVGKMTLALNLAQALNCDAPDRPCGSCASCSRIASGKHSDIRIIGLENGNSRENKARDIGIEQIRDIQHSAALPPFEGKFKVFIIDGAEQLSNEAANCLLKTLEEPVENVIYLLLTVNEQSVLPTVISRCQRLELNPLPAASIEKSLIKQQHVEPDKAMLLARLSHGCPGWAINAFEDEAILYERSERLEKIRSVIRSSFEERFAYAAQMATQFTQNRRTVQDELGLWTDWWRDLLLVKAGSADSITNIDFTNDITEMANSYDISQIRIFISRLQEAASQLQMNASPRLVLEVLMLNIPWRSI